MARTPLLGNFAFVACLCLLWLAALWGARWISTPAPEFWNRDGRFRSDAIGLSLFFNDTYIYWNRPRGAPAWAESLSLAPYVVHALPLDHYRVPEWRANTQPDPDDWSRRRRESSARLWITEPWRTSGWLCPIRVSMSHTVRSSLSPPQFVRLIAAGVNPRDFYADRVGDVIRDPTYLARLRAGDGTYTYYSAWGIAAHIVLIPTGLLLFVLLIISFGNLLMLVFYEHRLSSWLIRCERRREAAIKAARTGKWGLCWACGYDAGWKAPKCPECGKSHLLPAAANQGDDQTPQDTPPVPQSTTAH